MFFFHITDRSNTNIFFLKNHRYGIFDARDTTFEDIHISDQLGQPKDDNEVPKENGTKLDDLKIRPKKLSDQFYVHIWLLT